MPVQGTGLIACVTVSLARAHSGCVPARVLSSTLMGMELSCAPVSSRAQHQLPQGKPAASGVRLLQRTCCSNACMPWAWGACVLVCGHHVDDTQSCRGRSQGPAPACFATRLLPVAPRAHLVPPVTATSIDRVTRHGDVHRSRCQEVVRRRQLGRQAAVHLVSRCSSSFVACWHSSRSACRRACRRACTCRHACRRVAHCHSATPANAAAQAVEMPPPGQVLRAGNRMDRDTQPTAECTSNLGHPKIARASCTESLH